MISSIGQNGQAYKEPKRRRWCWGCQKTQIYVTEWCAIHEGSGIVSTWQYWRTVDFEKFEDYFFDLKSGAEDPGTEVE